METSVAIGTRTRLGHALCALLVFLPTACTFSLPDRGDQGSPPMLPRLEGRIVERSRIGNFEEAQARTGWPIMRGPREGYALNLPNSWIELTTAGVRLRVQYWIGPTLERIALIESAADPLSMDRSLRLEPVGQYRLARYRFGDQAAARFETGAELEGKPVVATVIADEWADVTEFVQQLPAIGNGSGAQAD